MNGVRAVRYTPDWAERWDRFVMDLSANGTFLQTRRFLSYHPEGRFEDASWLLTRENGEIVAALPAAMCMIDGKPVLRSHPGSTFGGIVYSSSVRDASKLLSVIRALEEAIKSDCAAAELRITPELFMDGGDALIRYCLFHEGYIQECEIATWIPLAGRDIEAVREGYSRNKRADLKKCSEQGLTARYLTTDEEIAEFHALLSLNLKKFDAEPVHTVSELKEFKSSRLTDEISFIGVHDLSGALVAAGCLFYFRQANVWHTQYLATDTGITGYAPSAFLYDAVFSFAIERGCKAVSLGTSTFERGHVLNEGLTQSKENYGASHSINLIYSKAFD